MILESNIKQRNHTELNSAENTNLLPAAKGLLVYRSKTNLILDLCKLIITLNSSFEYLNKVKKNLISICLALPRPCCLTLIVCMWMSFNVVRSTAVFS